MNGIHNMNNDRTSRDGEERTVRDRGRDKNKTVRRKDGAMAPGEKTPELMETVKEQAGKMEKTAGDRKRKKNKNDNDNDNNDEDRDYDVSSS